MESTRKSHVNDNLFYFDSHRITNRLRYRSKSAPEKLYALTKMQVLFQNISLVPRWSFLWNSKIFVRRTLQVSSEFYKDSHEFLQKDREIASLALNAGLPLKD